MSTAIIPSASAKFDLQCLKDMSDALTRKIGDNIEYIKKKEPGLVARGVLPPAEEVEAEYQLQRSQKKLRESESGNVSGSGR
ncbi:hypothetical protein VTN96DRAFT_9080 [Rasamsonia emersonii]